MATIAVYSLKGGVGKTTFAINLAWASAVISKRRTILWDLDPQSAATFLLSDQDMHSQRARSIFSKDIDMRLLVQPTAVPGLDLLAADISLRGLDLLFHTLGKKKRLAKLIEALGRDYDRIILDCPPGLTETSEQVLRAADIVIVPVIPSPLSRRALDEIIRFLQQHGGGPAILPVFSMVDRRRTLHQAAIDAEKDWPVVPMASAVERMSSLRKPLGAFAPTSPAAQRFAELWTAIERRLIKSKTG